MALYAMVAVFFEFLSSSLFSNGKYFFLVFPKISQRQFQFLIFRGRFCIDENHIYKGVNKFGEMFQMEGFSINASQAELS
jgi:hypothetical protein